MPKDNKKHNQIKNRYEKLKDGHIEWFLDAFYDIIAIDNDANLDILIAYLSIKTEQAQRMALYATMVRKYKVDSNLAAAIAGNSHLKRGTFREQYEKLTGQKLWDKTIALGKKAEDIRDQIMHGKGLVSGRGILFAKKVNSTEKKYAIIWFLEYAELFNDQFQQIFTDEGETEPPNFKPFGQMQSFAAGISFNDRATSERKLKELGIPMPKENP